MIGHVLVCFYHDNYIERVDFKIIYSFHMFLFIFISGYLVPFIGSNVTFHWVKKRFIRLMVPYIVWTAIFGFVSAKKFTLYNYFMALIEPSFWFLIVLFLCDISYWFINKITQGKWLLYMAVVLSLLANIIYLITKNLITSSNILHMYAIYLPFYFWGVFSCIYKNNLLKTFNSYSYFLILLYPASMTIYTYENHDFFNNTVNWFLKNFTGNVLPVNVLNTISVLYNHFFVAPLGVLFFGWAVYKIYKYKFLRNKFGYIGRYTLIIYITEGFFFADYTGVLSLDILLSIILGTIMPIFIDKLSMKISPNLHYVLLGSKK